MVELGGRGKPFDVTPLRFTDTEPVFTADGKHLAFLSVRSLDPVYDSFVFDLSFPNGCRPHLVPLAADTPSPFDPEVGGRPVGGDAGIGRAVGADVGAERARAGPRARRRPSAKPKKPEPTRVDVESLDQRLVPLPVPGGHYEQLRAVAGGLVWLKSPLQGVLGDDRAKVEDEPDRPVLEHIDLKTGKTQELAEGIDRVEVSGDGTRLVVADKGDLRVIPAGRKAEKDDPEIIKVDLDRVRVEVDPRAEWRQMYDEAWRLMRDHYWRADMRGVDWPAAGDRYRPLLDRLGVARRPGRPDLGDARRARYVARLRDAAAGRRRRAPQAGSARGRPGLRRRRLAHRPDRAGRVVRAAGPLAADGARAWRRRWATRSWLSTGARPRSR